MQQEHVYRNGRLLLPQDLVDRGPQAQARWLSEVPVADRARAFRALPLNIGAAAFLLMESRARIGLLTGLNPQSIRHLMSVAKDAFLLETLRDAGEDVHDAVLAGLPDWRRQRIEEAYCREVDGQCELEQQRRKTEARQRTGLSRLYHWLARTG